MSIKITNENYDTYKTVYQIICKNIFENLPISPDSNPINVLDNWEKKSKAMAKKALQVGINDLLSSLKDYPNEVLLQINAELAKNGIQNIHTLLKIVEQTIAKVLAKKKIKNIDEYYIIKEIIDDVSSSISEKDRNCLLIYFSDFEINNIGKSAF
jgi:hypothetical protein